MKTFRAKTMPEALTLVREELGNDAVILQTREVRERMWGILPGSKLIEITAAPAEDPEPNPPTSTEPIIEQTEMGTYQPRAFAGTSMTKAPQETDPVETSAPLFQDSASRLSDEIRKGIKSAQDIFGSEPEYQNTHQQKNVCRESHLADQEMVAQLDKLQAMVQDLYKRSSGVKDHSFPDSLFHLFTELIESEFDENFARRILRELQREASTEQLQNRDWVQQELNRLLKRQLICKGAIKIDPVHCRVITLVGPTGVGKTTTIAKLAANFRLREKCRVGLITVDTYRIAAVEQLKTYAEIIDLPMQVVSSPNEMAAAVDKMADLDLIFIDTAGRSPKDESQLQELKRYIQEAQADEVHLVLSSNSSLASLLKTAEKFITVGATRLMFTKLDEANGLGNIIPVLESTGLQLSYVTNGQNVPDDIRIADSDWLAEQMLLPLRESELT